MIQSAVPLDMSLWLPAGRKVYLKNNWQINSTFKYIDRTEIGRYTHLSLIKKLLIFYNKEIRIELVDKQ